MPAPPPRYVVRTRLPGHRRFWLLAALPAVLLLVLAFAAGRWSAGAGPRTPPRANAQALAELSRLRQQRVMLLRDRQVTRIATDALRRSLADRDAEIESLRADLAFYTRLIGGDERAPGLSVAALRLHPVPGTRGYAFTVILLQTARGGRAVHGRLTLALQGVQGGRAVRVGWPQLVARAQHDGLPFAFKYFQPLHGMLVLPPGFVPARIEVTLKPAGGSALSRDLSWASAVAGKDTEHVSQNS